MMAPAVRYAGSLRVNPGRARVFAIHVLSLTLILLLSLTLTSHPTRKGHTHGFVARELRSDCFENNVEVVLGEGCPK